MKRKIGNGFGFRITQAALWLLAALSLSAVGLMFYIVSSNFVSWINWTEGYRFSSPGDVYTIRCYDRTLSGEYDESLKLLIVFEAGEDKPYLGLAEEYYDIDVTKTNFVFTGEDKKTETLTFTNSLTGETEVFYYDEISGYPEWGFEVVPISLLSVGAFSAIWTVLNFIFAFRGKKSIAANNCAIAFNFIFAFCPFGLCGLVGGIKGKLALQYQRHFENASNPATTTSVNYERQTNKEASNSIPSEQTSDQARTYSESVNNSAKNIEDYAIDYENKPLVSSILDRENCENLLLKNEDGHQYEFKQIYVKPDGDVLYLLAETVGLSKEEGGGMVVFRIDYDNDLVHIEHDDAIFTKIFNAYEIEANGVEEQRIKRSDFKLDLYDASIDEKTWKQFKKTATQEELATIAIGAKYRICHSRILNIVYTVGIILSILLLWPTQFYSLIAYPVFAFLATKSIRYEDTYSQSYRKLTKENKAFVDGYFNNNLGLTILDIFIKIAILYITLPYQAILLFIGTFAPNFVISKNGILVSIPKGYDVGNLGAIGAYYSSFSFLDEWEASRHKYTGTVTVDGYDISVHSADDVTYYDDNGHCYKKEGDKLIRN